MAVLWKCLAGRQGGFHRTQLRCRQFRCRWMHGRLPGTLWHLGLFEHYGHDGCRPASHPSIPPGAARVSERICCSPIWCLAILHQQDTGGNASRSHVPDSYLHSHIFLDGFEGQRSPAGGSLMAPWHCFLVLGFVGRMWGSISAKSHSVGTSHTDPTDAFLRAVCPSGQNPRKPQMGSLPLSLEICHQFDDGGGVPICQAGHG
mmetsp:Transcript_30684/g.37648  ORF Transcript_30684/g.37648 Transcript_30684/m.37648 type:complete len:203 (+) Transcript_30684:103-711(+)